jgi:hypothetical protein
MYEHCKVHAYMYTYVHVSVFWYQIVRIKHKCKICLKGRQKTRYGCWKQVHSYPRGWRYSWVWFLDPCPRKLACSIFLRDYIIKKLRNALDVLGFRVRVNIAFLNITIMLACAVLIHVSIRGSSFCADARWEVAQFPWQLLAPGLQFFCISFWNGEGYGSRDKLSRLPRPVVPSPNILTTEEDPPMSYLVTNNRLHKVSISAYARWICIACCRCRLLKTNAVVLQVERIVHHVLLQATVRASSHPKRAPPRAAVRNGTSHGLPDALDSSCFDDILGRMQVRTDVRCAGKVGRRDKLWILEVFGAIYDGRFRRPVKPKFATFVVENDRHNCAKVTHKAQRSMAISPVYASKTDR